MNITYHNPLIKQLRDQQVRVASRDKKLEHVNRAEKLLAELDSSRTGTIVAHCKMGGRSAKAAEFLRQAGFKNVLNLTGGINAWSEKVDPKVPKY